MELEIDSDNPLICQSSLQSASKQVDSMAGCNGQTMKLTLLDKHTPGLRAVTGLCKQRKGGKVKTFPFSSPSPAWSKSSPAMCMPYILIF